MSKYSPLSDRLSAHGADEWLASFAEIEEVLGFPLPKGARSGAAWWANDPGKPHSRSWVAWGWEVAEVNRAGEAVTFRRNTASADIEAAGGIAHAQPSVDEPWTPGPASGAGGAPAEDYRAQTVGAGDVQPDAMRRASREIARALKARKAGPAVAAGVAVLAGVAALVARNVMRRRSGPPA